MSEFREAEFTGERVIPGLVDPDLLNEHLARYRFANRIAAGMSARPRALDAGCGTGYGAAELKAASSITATDISAEAIGHALRHYAASGARFVQSSCEALPFAAGSFDLITAFEVIEHLERWPELISEANRVLTPQGVLVVSTPNRDYYAESRQDAGPNLFHHHEFTYEEFRTALLEVFPHVRIWTQNHAGAIVFSPLEDAAERMVLDASQNADAVSANFFVAICSHSPIAPGEIFAWLPTTANVLREREHHIAKLLAEVEQKESWLSESLAEHAELQRRHEAVTAELERGNQWAEGLNREIAARDGRIVELQGEVAGRLEWVADLEAQIRRGNEEIVKLSEETRSLRLSAEAEIARLNDENTEVRRSAQADIERLEATVIERSDWAHRLNDEIARLAAIVNERDQRIDSLSAALEASRADLRQLADSRWVRAGVRMGVAPAVRDGK